MFRYPSAVADIDLLTPCSRKSAQQQLLATGAYKKEEIPEQPNPNAWSVYFLREATDGPCSYVGHTGKDGKDVDVRLAEHNETMVKGKGAEETRGKKWNICRVYYGFADQTNAREFEDSINANEVECWQDRLPVIASIREMAKWHWVEEDETYTDADL